MPKKGQVCSSEHRAKIAAAMRGNRNSAGERNAMKRPEVRAKISAALRGVPRSWMKGPLNPNWTGGPEASSTTRCACGCGTTIPAYVGHPGILRPRRRRYVLGHQAKGKPRPDFAAWLRENASANADSRKHPKGEAHWNWKGGITEAEHLERNSPRYRAWRDAVYRRDGWACTAPGCGKKCQQGDITADHIVPWAERPDLRYEVSNGRTLCRTCHARRHGLGESLRP